MTSVIRMTRMMTAVCIGNNKDDTRDGVRVTMKKRMPRETTKRRWV